MAQMSKDLATIRINCEIGFSLEEAKLDSLYTPEAYQYMKQLEFKSILQKFGEDAFASSEMEKSFRLVNDFGEAQVIFDRAQRAEEIGAQLVIEKGEVVALALCLDGTSIYAIPAVGFLTGTVSGGGAGTPDGGGSVCDGFWISRSSFHFLKIIAAGSWTASGMQKETVRLWTQAWRRIC